MCKGVKLKGHYYCCGSHNFEYDDKETEVNIIKDCNDDTIRSEIYDELNNNHTNITNNTILDINCDIERIFEYLSGI